MKDREFLIWLHYRLAEIHGEDPYKDYMWKLRSMIEGYDKEKVTPNTSDKSIQELENET